MTSEVSTSPFRPRIAVTLGDPAGIGPEVVLKALARQDWGRRAEITVVGSEALLAWTYGQLGAVAADGSPLAPRRSLNLMAVDPPDAPVDLRWGEGTAYSGAVSFALLRAALAHTVAGKFDAIVTAPIAKSAWQAAGHDYPGQTELLAEAAQSERFAMAFVARSPFTGWPLRALLATTHIPLAAVPTTLTPELMDRKLALLIEALHQDFGIEQPRVAIAGLNPHSGEAGQLGSEERDWLIPWLEAQRQRYPQVQLDGPVPPDTLWVRPAQAWYGSGDIPQNTHDAYLALYHDQGLIPVKLMAFDRAVNTTLGLPFVRTSPDHGTAFDIAGQGIAAATSLVAALELAITLASQRHQTRPVPLTA